MEKKNSFQRFKVLCFVVVTSHFLSGCASNYVLSDSFQKIKAGMTRSQAEAVLQRVVQTTSSDGGFCVVGRFASIRSEIRVKQSKINFAANELIPIGSHTTSSGSIQGGNYRMETITEYKRVPGKYEIDISRVKRVNIYTLGKMLSKDACFGTQLPPTDYRLVFNTDQMTGGYFHIYAHAADLDSVLAAFAVFSPEIQFSN
jgi:hypothetical protein